MPLHDALRQTLELLSLLFELSVGAAPLLRRIRGKLAPVHSEVLLADQAELRCIEEHVAKQPHDLAVELAHETCQRRKVRTAVGRQRHEYHVPAAGLRQHPARDYPL